MSSEDGSSSVRMSLWGEVSNAKELLQLVRACEGQAALLRVGLLYHVDQIRTAVLRSLRARDLGRMRTRALSSEILYSLSPSRSISEAVDTFGAGENDRTLVLLVCDASLHLEDKVLGEPLTLAQLPSLCDLDAVRKTYKILKTAKEERELLNAILTKIAVKEYT